MRIVVVTLICLGQSCFGQATFDVTGTSVPVDLLQQNYGRLPRHVGAFDLNICNSTSVKQSVISSQIFQALAKSNPEVQPIGRQIMLATILRNQGRSPLTILNVSVASVSALVSVLGVSKYTLPAQWAAGLAIASFSGQQIISSLRPVISADQLQKFESQVLEPALVLDAGSCVERTVFTVTNDPNTKTKAKALNFSVR
jgi:hypothetical protein